MGQVARQTFSHITHDDYEGEPISGSVGNLQGHIYNTPRGIENLVKTTKY